MNFMAGPYQSSSGSPANAFAKTASKKAILGAIKSVSPTAGKVASIGEELAGLFENPGMQVAKKAVSSIPGAVSEIGLKDIAGPALAVYSNPTPIADDPMEGMKGADSSQYHREHVEPYISGNAYGPAPDMGTEHRNFESSWRDKMDSIQRLADAEEERKRKAIASTAASYAIPMISRLASLAGGIYSGM